MADETSGMPESADAPTEVMAETPAEPSEKKKLSGLTIALLIALGVLLIGIIVLLVLLLLPRESGTPAPLPTPSDSATPSMEPTPSETPSATPTPRPTPTSSPSETSTPVEPSRPDGKITSFTGPSSPGCLSSEAPAYEPSVDITFNWSAQNVSEVAFGIATNDAINEPYVNMLAPTGSITVGFPCDQAKQKYTLTVAGADGVHVSKSITVNNPSA